MLLGIDLGTMFIKSVVFDLDGKVISSAGEEVNVEYPRPGWAEQDMESMWKICAKTIRDSTSRIEKIAGVGVSGQMDGTFLIGERGRPARKKAIIWLDSRGDKKEQIERWEKDGTSHDISRYGGIVMTCRPLMHMWWLAKNEPETLEDTATHLGCKDWIRFKLAGEESRFMDYTEASVTAMYDPIKKRW